MSIFICLKRLSSFFIILFFIIGCSKSSPNTPEVVGEFDIYKFSGTWYEIATIRQKDEKNLKNTTINYSIESENRIKIVTSGEDKNENFKKSEATAKFSSESNKAALQKRLFGPVYKPYNIVKVDGYRYAMIFGDEGEMWIISRTKTIPELVKMLYLNYAQKNGYDLTKILWTAQK